MKYVLMFCETEQFQKEVEAMDQAGRDRLLERVTAWLEEYSGKITHRVKLGEPHTATTVRLEGDDMLVTDGPFVEGKEAVSGIVEAEVADLDEALKMARSWPACPVVEIRPVAF